MAGKLPYKVGASLTVQCESLGTDGRGRGVVDGHDIRMRFAIPGEQVRVRLDHVGHHALWGTVQGALVPSAERVTPPCPVVQTCGGCPWQHIAGEAQQRYRLEELRRLLEPIAADAAWHEWSPSPAVVEGYRTRALMMLRHQRGRLRAGFYKPRSQDLVAAEDCLVHTPALRRLVSEVTEVLDRSQLPTWRHAGRPGLLRAFAVRTDGRSTPLDALVTLVVTRPDEQLHGLAQNLLGIPGVAGVHANINDRDGGPVMGRETVHLLGRPYHSYDFGGLSMDLGPTAFVQTRQDAGAALVQIVAKMLGDPIHHLADIFGGVGVFGLWLHRHGRAPRVSLVESSPGAVADARRYVSHHALEGIAILEADALDGVQRLVEAGDGGPDVAIVDPPRSGLSPEILEGITAMSRLHTLVYVSCNPKTLARDVCALAADGWAITDISPVDMFPNTPHCEVVVRCIRTKAKHAVVATPALM